MQAIVLNGCKSYEEMKKVTITRIKKKKKKKDKRPMQILTDEKHYGCLPILSDLLISPADNSPDNHLLFLFFSL